MTNCCCEELQRQIRQLRLQLLNQTTAPTITVDRKISRDAWEYDISFDGNILAVRGANAPTPVVSAVLGQPYTLSFPAAVANPSIDVVVAEDLTTGDSQGIVTNAFIVQNANFISSTVAQFELLSGDDGGGVDDSSRRAVTV